VLVAKTIAGPARRMLHAFKPLARGSLAE